MPSREYHRVRIRLPARLRWATPFGRKIELSETIDVSRSGLLVSSKECHAAGVPLWVTFPYDTSLPDGQPEVFSSVVRCVELPEAMGVFDGRKKVSVQTSSTHERPANFFPSARSSGASSAPRTFALALHFERPVHSAPNGNRKWPDPERRGGPRRSLSVPIRVRQENVPWFEEAMSLDFSSQGMRFCSHREYAPGEQLRISLEDAAATPWSGSREFRARVVRVLPTSDGVALDVSICRVA